MAIDNSISAEAERNSLLALIRKQDTSGRMSPKLCHILDADGSQPSTLKLQWESSLGMGETQLTDLTPPQGKSALELMEQGYIVPAFESFWPHRIRLLEHFDDVRWGYNEQSEIVMYRLSLAPGSQPDKMIIARGRTYAPAVAELERRIIHNSLKAYRTSQGSPLLLNGDTKIVPILTDPEEIEHRVRQLEFQEAHPG